MMQGKASNTVMVLGLLVMMSLQVICEDTPPHYEQGPTSESGSGDAANSNRAFGAHKSDELFFDDEATSFDDTETGGATKDDETNNREDLGLEFGSNYREDEYSRHGGNIQCGKSLLPKGAKARLEDDDDTATRDEDETAFDDVGFNDEETFNEDGSSFFGQDQPGHRIVGGTVTTIRHWPWQISLRRNDNPTCGGSIVNKYWIVTAAHCFSQSRRPEDYKVAYGKSKKMESEAGEMFRKVVRIAIHPNYGKVKRHDSDIALVRVDKPITYSNRMLPVCLPNANRKLADGRDVVVTGYGQTKNTGGENLLKMANIKMIDLQRCRRLNKQMSDALTDKMLCAGILEGGTDTCQGDSGGPLVVKSKKTGAWTLYGVTSFGYGCADKNMPGVYTDVPHFIHWIRQITRHP